MNNVFPFVSGAITSDNNRSNNNDESNNTIITTFTVVTTKPITTTELNVDVAFKNTINYMEKK